MKSVQLPRKRTTAWAALGAALTAPQHLADGLTGALYVLTRGGVTRISSP